MVLRRHRIGPFDHGLGGLANEARIAHSKTGPLVGCSPRVAQSASNGLYLELRCTLF